MEISVKTEEVFLTEIEKTKDFSRTFYKLFSEARGLLPQRVNNPKTVISTRFLI